MTWKSDEIYYNRFRIIMKYNQTLYKAILLSVFTVFMSCRKLLKQPARSLLAGSAMTSGYKSSGKRFQRLPLYFRLILRNMRNDWQRVLITVSSIAGCCVLMIVGLTFSFTLKNTLGEQYNSIIRYDAELYFDPQSDTSAENQIRSILEDNDIDCITLMNTGCIADINNKFEQCSMICGQPDDIGRYIELITPEGNDVRIPDEGVLITHTLAKSTGLSVGDDIILYDTQMKPYNVKISGIFTYYIGQSMIISEKAYADIFKAEPEHDQFWISCGSSDIPDELYSVSGFLRARQMEDVRKMQDDYIAASDKMAWMLIILAGVMAFLIILDLVNMYVMKKKRELVIMRINGFSMKNTVLYAALECVATTLAGIIAGVFAGILFADLVVSSRETPNFSFIHGANMYACMISASITAFYSFIIHFSAFRKIRKYKITSLDTNE